MGAKNEEDKLNKSSLKEFIKIFGSWIFV